MGILGNLMLTGGRADAPFDSNIRGIPQQARRGETKPVAAFITVQSLTSFPAVALLITVIWRFCSASLGWNSRALPLVAAFVVGLILYVVTIDAARPRSLGQWFSGAFIAAVNSLYLGLSVLGIDVALEVARIADSVTK